MSVYVELLRLINRAETPEARQRSKSSQNAPLPTLFMSGLSMGRTFDENDRPLAYTA
jgi:hypothetical protein